MLGEPGGPPGRDRWAEGDVGLGAVCTTGLGRHPGGVLADSRWVAIPEWGRVTLLDGRLLPMSLRHSTAGFLLQCCDPQWEGTPASNPCSLPGAAGSRQADLGGHGLST